MCTAAPLADTPVPELSTEDKCRATTRTKAQTLFADGYIICLTDKRGIHCIQSEDGHTHLVDVIGETCSAHPTFSPGIHCIFEQIGECKHLLAAQNLVLCGIAPGMSEDWIAEYYDPSLLPELPSAPDSATTVDDDLPIDAPIGVPSLPVSPATENTIFGRCSCGQMGVRGETCFRCGEKVVHAPDAMTAVPVAPVAPPRPRISDKVRMQDFG